jgi:hypothetical protein
MIPLPRVLGCLVICATSACGFDSGGSPLDTGAEDETATDTAGTDEVGSEGQDDVGTEAGEGGEVESGGGANCGNGVIEQGEPCDGDDLGGQTCNDLGFLGGTLVCADDCTVDATGCANEICGNGIKEADEECDSFDFGGLNCTDLGFGPGLPLCNRDCTIDTSPCTTAGEGESCNGLDPCPNDLNCVENVCYDGSADDPCENDWDCESNDCVGETLFSPGMCG